ncbi:MAG TPA: RMD1 family protein [Stellaceae bacterium]|nr:RMD1 family protein [Stellaceae bacterium]
MGAASGILQESATETVSVRTLLLGERLDTRGLELKDALATLPLTLRLPDGGIAVLFRYGVVVLFNVQPAAESAFLERVSSLITDPLATREVDEARLQIAPGAEEPIDISGTIFLREASTVRLQLVADILAKSLVLSHYEARIADLFDRIEPIATSLRAKGRPAAYSRDLLRQIGNVLTVQQKMVGRVETGEKPELLWEHTVLERFYLRLAEEYELRERDRALDRKLEVIARTVETVLSLLQSRSSLRVEWYIVALILAELMLSLYPPTLWHLG